MAALSILLRIHYQEEVLEKRTFVSGLLVTASYGFTVERKCYTNHGLLGFTVVKSVER